MIAAETMTDSGWFKRDGIFSRSLGSMESFYSLLATPEGSPVHFMIGTCVKIEYLGNDENIHLEKALRRAWRDTRRDSPIIAASFNRMTQEMTIPDYDEAGEEEWLDQSYMVHENIEADELFSSFTSKFAIVLHYLPTFNQIMIQAPHSIIDGRGILLLYNSFFEKLGSPSQTKARGVPRIKTSDLPESYDKWLNIPATPTEKNINDAQSLFYRVLAQENPIRLPDVDFTQHPQRPVHLDVELPQQTTSSIISACKQKHISVTSAWHAALVLAVKKIQATAGQIGTSYAQLSTLDLRRYCPSPFQSPKDSICTLQTAIPFAVNLGSESEASFDNISKELNKQYKDPFAFADHDFGFLNPYITAGKRMFEDGGPQICSTPYTSSMGVVDQFLKPRYGDWEIKDFWIGSTMMTPDLQMYLWTFQGQLVLSACYNEAYYGRQTVTSIIEGIEVELVAGLGI